MRIEKRTVGFLDTNAYLLFSDDGQRVLLVDPGAGADRLREACGGITPDGILLTHGHADHIGALEAMREGGVPVAICRADAGYLTDGGLNLSDMMGMRLSCRPAERLLDEGPCELGGWRFEVLHTPGHTPGSCCFLFDGVLFSGDTLFAGGYGRTDFPGGDPAQLAASLHRLAGLPAQTRVFPGHGPETLIGRERIL